MRLKEASHVEQRHTSCCRALNELIGFLHPEVWISSLWRFHISSDGRNPDRLKSNQLFFGLKPICRTDFIHDKSTEPRWSYKCTNIRLTCREGRKTGGKLKTQMFPSFGSSVGEYSLILKSMKKSCSV